METQLTCPSCHTIVNHRLNLPLVITCTSCNTTLLAEKDKEVISAEAKWSSPSEISALKLFSKGKYEGKDFELIGRIRSISSSNISNDWLMYFKDGSYRWLSETMFTYFISEAKPFSLTAAAIKDCKGGSIVRIGNDNYIVNDISKQIQLEVEGEIPFDSYNDEPYFKYELISALNTGWATVCIYDKNTIEGTMCKKVELSDLQLSAIVEYKD